MTEKKPFIINGRHVLAGFVVFFGIIIGVNIVFITMANKSFPGETVDDPYEKGIHFNETLGERAVAAELGWKITYSLASAEDGSNQFVVKVVDAGGPVDGLDIDLAIMWTTARQADTQLRLIPAGDGVYRGLLEANGLPNATMSFTGLVVRSSDDAKMTFAGRL
ncbi:MAG: hypothetical protein COA47_03635 [Robiginitomaculum sp.]|nr:MAG: hypothetical protein COA47_03635 [Robiginitomaculum sp.]